MSNAKILAAIDAEIERLQKAKALFSDEAAHVAPKKRGPKPGIKRVLSPEAKARIAAGQKKRWANQIKGEQ